ncbi:uncharacterized protein LOC116250167 isoform X3 [Nymphaea colorata]|uniref:uncharacterized protein LOC116250167 isoform X3 n=1 Tax=Nymphaea colorata TaxID=210225 RepID=UPI00129DD572|nr:uncharacterized protein LOC116250167 isoform X3 [Nymphaea colorata]
MFLREAIRARVASFLRPLTEEEPRFELELGLLRSRATARDLFLKPSSLNSLLDEPSALCFESIRIGEVVVYFSLWSSPLLKIEARGIRFDLKGSDRIRRSGSLSEETKKEKIERLDPEGISLHNALENILKARIPGSSIMDSLTAVILGNCQVWLKDIDFQMQIPFYYGGSAQIGSSNKLYLLYVNLGEFNANEQVAGCYELLKGIFEVIIMGRDVAHLVFSFKDLNVKLKQSDENCPTSSILFMRSLLLSVRMKKLQPLEFEIDVPEVDMELSHRDLFVIVLLHAMLNTENSMITSSDYNLLLVEEVKGTRSGKMLWREAACQMHNLLPSFRLWRLVNLVLVWCQYVKVYESLLKQVGYPSVDLFSTVRSRLSKDARFSNHIKHLWKEATETENGLPAEGVALARRVARHRLTVSSHVASELSDDERTSFPSFALIFFPALLKGIGLMVHFFISMLHKVIHAFYCLYRLVWRGILQWNTENEEQDLLPEDSIHAINKPGLVEGNQYILFTISKFVVNIIPGDLPHVNDGESLAKPFPMDLLALCVVFNQLYLDFAADDNMHQLTFACGELVSHSYSLSRVHGGLGAPTEKVDRVKRYGTEEHSPKTILSSSPAVQISLVELDSQGSFSSDFNGFLRGHINEMYLEWQSSYGFSKLKDVSTLAKPFFLCRLKNYIINPCCSGPNFGLLKLGLSMGKLTCKLNISLFMGIYFQIIQVAEHAFYTGKASSCGAISNSKTFHNRELQTDVDSVQDFYADKVKMKISRIVFLKQVVIGAAIVGPRIQVSLPAGDSPISGKHGFIHGTPRDLECVTIALDLKDIYSAVWSVSDSVSTAPEKEDNGSGTCPYKWLKKPPVVHIPEADTDESFIVQGQLGHNLFLKLEGLSLLLESIMDNQQQNILKPVSLTLESSYCRKYLHSLATVVTVLSMTLVGRATDLTISLCMDELEEVFQVLGSSLNAVSHISSAHTFSHRDDLPHGITTSQGMWATQSKCAAVDSQQCFDSFIIDGTQFVMDINLEFRPLDIILNNYRNLVGHTSVAASATGPSKKMLAFPNTGAEFCIKKSSLNFFWEERVSVSFLLELAGIRSLIFGSKSESPGEVLMQNEPSDDSDVLCELSLPSCSFSLQSGVNGHAVPSGQDADGNVVSSRRLSCNDLDTLQNPHFLYSDNHHPIDGSYGSNLNPDSSSKFSWLSSSTSWLLIHVQLSKILIVENSAKIVDMVKDGRHFDMNNIEAVVAVSKECRAISSEIQGGLFLLETKSLVVYASSLQAYTTFFSRLLSYFPFSSEVSDPKSSPRMKTSKYLNPGVSMELQLNREGTDYDSSRAPSSDRLTTLLEVGWKSLKVLTVRLSQVSIKFILMDACVGIRELDIETNFLFKYEKNSRRNFFFDLSRFAILGLHWGRTNNCKELGVQAPRFRSSILSNAETTVGSGQPPHVFQVPGTNSSGSQAPGKKLLDNGEGFGFYSLICQNLILKCVTASVMIDKELPGTMSGSATPKDGWGGSVSVSGVDLKMAIPEIQMLLSLIEDLCNVSSYDSSEISKEEVKVITQGGSGSLEDTISNGVVVAVKDLDQHVYLAVELVENNHHLVGAAHYSLVGERALFRVQCCSQRKGFSSVSCFSLISLYAKNDKGEPLRVNFKQRSNLVDISGTDDKGGALWQAIPYRPASYEGNDELETYNHFMEKAFFLLNCKSDLGVAFVDRLPVFVKKPGSLFKMKILSTSPRVGGINLNEASSSNLGNTSDTNIQRNVSQDINARHVNILIERVCLTILHEVSDANDNLPLLRVSINNIQCVIQVLYSKTRLITNFRTMMENYDCSSSTWREVVSPFEICMFCRFTTNLEAGKNRVPFHFHCSIPKIEVSLCQFSLDVILFLIGKLGLAGPYIVRHAIVLGNCCKVKNFSGANLLCRVENHDTIIATKRSASVVLRPVSPTKRNPDGIPSISLQLLLGEFFTSPVRISHLNTGRCAWKTRLASHGANCCADSRTFPGPFVVVETAKKSEDGFCIAVYPMLTIHNGSGLSLDLRCRRPQETEDEFATVLLCNGDSIDDSVAAFESLSMSGLMKKALTSLSLGNFLVSIRPKADEGFGGCSNLVTVEWSEDLKGGKPVCLSGLFDKLSYQLKKGFGGKSKKATFSSIKCRVQSQENVSYIHFLVQSIGRDVPVLRPPKVSGGSHLSTSPIAVQEQKEIYLLPTVQVYNVLESEIHVMLSENVEDNNKSSWHIGRRATIACGSSACFYVNPSIIYFTFALTELGLKCKPINSSDMIKKLNRSMSEFHYLDKELDFGGGRLIANLRFSRGDRGTLEVTIFTTSILRNATDISFFCCDANNKSISREVPERYWSTCSPELGFVLDPGSTASWFFRSNKVRLLWLKDKVADALLDLDALSGFTEIGSELLSETGIKHVIKFGISLKPISSKVIVPSRFVHIAPRYVVSNESEVDIYVRQSCVHSDDLDGVTVVTSRQKSALQMQMSGRKRKTDIIDTMFRSHGNSNDDSMYFIQFCLKQDDWSWSGPVCVTSLGHFFLRFRRKPTVLGYDEPNYRTQTDNDLARIGTVDIEEEESMLVMHFHLPSNIILPYRIENHLNDSAIMYQQKGIMEPETLASGRKVGYVWDDLSLPHTLIVRIHDMNIEREINIDKLSSWKPFYKVRQANSFVLSSLYTGVRDTKRTGHEASSSATGIFRIAYKVFADGSQRVLRIGELVDNANGSRSFHQHSIMQKNIEFRVSFFGVRLLEDPNQDVGEREASDYLLFLQARVENVCLRSLFANHQTFNVMRVQSLNVDEKWQGAPFAALLRRHQLDNNDATDQILSIIIISRSGNTSVTEVKYCSIVVQPLDLNFDEETVMKIVPFWRTSLSDPNSTRQQIYFKHFEIHPIKIIASFLPGNLNMSYSTSQEALWSFLHNVIKVPTVKAAVVELNGVLLTHALLTTRELLIKCMQHYSWYAMRAIYIAKGSSLLPPSFASIFDDSAFSSLDVFFDPSSSLHSLPGLTIGALKFIRKSIDGESIFGTKRYLGDLGKTLRRAGSNILFAAITEISDSVLRGAETSGFSGMVKGFHQGILNIAMEPSLIGSAFMEGGPSRRIKLDHSPGINEAYVEGYLQAMLDVLYKLEYLKVRVIDDEVLLKNLPPNSSLISDIVEHVKGFLIKEGLLKGESNASSLSTRRLYGGQDWKFGPMLLTLSEHLFVSFAIRFLRKQAGIVMEHVRSMRKEKRAKVPAPLDEDKQEASRKQALGKFVLLSVLAYIDGRLCRCIPNAIARRIVSGFLLSFLDENDKR